MRVQAVVGTSDSSCITSRQEKSLKVDDVPWAKREVNRWQGGKERGASELAALWSEIEMAIGSRRAVIARNYGGKLKLPRSSGGPLSGLATLFPVPFYLSGTTAEWSVSADRLRVTVSPESKCRRCFSAFYKIL